jgi:RNA polymerase sigma-70 factor (ECF subfamily)
MAAIEVRRSTEVTASKRRFRDEQEVILKAQRFEAEALAELFDEHFDGLYAYVNTLLGDAGASEELVRRTWQRALEGLPRYRRFDSGFQTWLERIANTLISEGSRAGADSPFALGETEGDASSAVRRAIRGLTPDQLDVIGLRFAAGLTAQEIARATGRGRRRVEALQQRGLLALRRALGEAKA